MVLSGCLSTAFRKRMIVVNPLDHIEAAPEKPEQNHGQVLDAAGLRRLVEAFQPYSLHPIVALAAATRRCDGLILIR